MINLENEVCICNSVTFKNIIEYIQKKSIASLQELFDDEECPVGNKCQSCREDGYNNDGLNLPLAFALAKKRD